MSTDTNTVSRNLSLLPESTERLANLCGQLDEHLHMIENRLGIEINNHGHLFKLTGDRQQVSVANSLLKNLYHSTSSSEPLTPQQVHLALKDSTPESEPSPQPTVVSTKRVLIKPRGDNQRGYVEKIRRYDINFGVGPAGTGKTYLAVACAVQALEKEEVKRIVLVRPAVEAGEKLGFLPGDLAQKVDPYLRPLYDALYEMLGFEKVARLIERHVIEIAPLAYMRGRTLNESFVILDESQNTTKEQMKMFLTRIGFGSHAVITGDATQIDLPNRQMSGLLHALEVLRQTEGIGVTHFNAKDVVRHTLVQRIVEAYDRYDADLPD